MRTRWLLPGARRRAPHFLLSGGAVSAEFNGWQYDKRYVEGQLRDLKENQGEQGEILLRLESKLSEIETELRSFKRAAQILVAIGTAIGAAGGWIVKALGKG